MKKKKQFNTKMFLTVVIFIVAIVPSIIAAILYYRSEQVSVAEQACGYEEQILGDMRGNFVEMQEQLKKIQYEVTSQFVALGMEKIDSTNLREGEVEKIHILESLLQSIRRTTAGVNNIYVISKKDRDVAYGSTYTFNKRWLLDNEWLNKDYVSSKEWLVVPEHKVDYLNASIRSIYADSCFSFITGMVNKDGDDAFEYILQVDMDAKYLYSFIHNIRVNGSDAVAIYYEDGNLAEKYNVDMQAEELLEKELQEGKKASGDIEVQRKGEFIFASTAIPEMDLVIYKLSRPFDNISNRNLYMQITLLILISMIVAAVAAARITSFFVRPFEKLIKDTMGTMGHATSLQSVSIDSRSSYIQKMAEHFNVLIDRINHLISSTLQQESEKKDLQMRMLQAQISPHFLYNTLNSVKWMALMRRQPEIAEAVTALVDLLEYCCRDTRTLVLLEEELSFLKNYIYIQRMRNTDQKIEIVFDIEKGAEKLKIIKFSLQPAVENAFIHAFPEHRQNAEIIIKGYTGDGRLFLVIQDNGVGFDAGSIQKNMTGIGIRNIDDRIKLTFGEEYGQRIDSQIGQGTRVEIVIPMVTEETGINETTD